MSAPVPAAQRNRGYGRWKGERTAQGLRWWVIARGNLSLALANRWTKVLLAVSLAPGFILAGITYFFLPLSAPTLHGLMGSSVFFAFLVAATVGARMISEDRRQGAFLAHFARPVTRLDYVAGKFVALLLPLLFVTAGPALLAIGSDASVDTETALERITGGEAPPDDVDTLGYLRQASYWGALGAVAWWSLLASASTAGIVLGLSALTTRARLAGLAWFAFVAFGWASHAMLQEILDKDWPALLSWMDNLNDVGGHLLGLRTDEAFNVHLEYTLLIRSALLLAAAAAGLVLVHESIRRAEGGVR